MLRTIPVLLGLALFLPCSDAVAVVIVEPSGLNVGDKYHLAFITSQTKDATSDKIADYNTFVQNLANNSGIGNTLGWTWTVVGSTPTVDARDNLSVTAPVYNLADQRVADGAASFWNNSAPYPISTDETGVLHTDREANRVYTGSRAHGVGEPFYQLGNTTPVHGGQWPHRVRMGLADLLSRVLYFNWSTPDTPRYFYAVSEELTLGDTPAAVPEPSTLAIWSLLTLCGIGIGWRRRRKA